MRTFRPDRAAARVAVRAAARFSAGLAAGLAVGLVVGLQAPAARAQIVTVPPGLAPGAGYRLVFVTSAVRDGASANVADYDAFVASRANAVPALAALGTTWRAVAETATVLAMDNTGTNPLVVGGTPTNPGVPFYRLDGLRVANDNAYFWAMAFPINPISISELGSGPPITVRAPDGSTQPWVWTGYGAAPSKLGTAFPIAAWASGGGANSWSGIAISRSDNAHALYAVSGILHAPQPAPLDPRVAVTALLGCMALGLHLLARSDAG